MTIEPFAPGTDPFTRRRLCSGITFTTCRFCTVTRSLPICPPMTGALEHLRGKRGCTNGTGCAQPVVLSVCGLSHTAESVTFHHTLESFSLRCANHVHINGVVEKINSDLGAGLIPVSKSLELGQVSLGAYSGFFEVTFSGLGVCLSFLSINPS